MDVKQQFLDLSVSQRSVFAAITNALLFTKLTDANGKEIGLAIDIVESIEQIAGEIPGKAATNNLGSMLTSNPKR